MGLNESKNRKESQPSKYPKQKYLPAPENIVVYEDTNRQNYATSSQNIRYQYIKPYSQSVNQNLNYEHNNLNNHNANLNKLNIVEPIKKDVNYDETVSNKHEIFLKKLIGKYNTQSNRRNRGFYCSVCDVYFVFSNNQPVIYHDETEHHLLMIQNTYNIKRYYCRTCKANFFGNTEFWVSHLDMELHQSLAKVNERNVFVNNENRKSNSYEKKNNSNCGSGSSSNNNNNKKKEENVCEDTSLKCDKMLNPIQKLSLYDVLSEQQDEKLSKIGLNFKHDIIEKFYNRLLNKNIGKFSFYCNDCEFWTDDDNSWRNHTVTHRNDSTITNAKVCLDCKLIILGDEKLKEFHLDDKSHERFVQFLLFNLNRLNDKHEKMIDDENDNCSESDDNNSDINYSHQKQKFTALLVKDLPPETTRNEILLYFKDFGRVKVINMHFAGPLTAKIIFTNRFVANNIVDGEIPIIIGGKKVKISLEYS